MMTKEERFLLDSEKFSIAEDRRWGIYYYDTENNEESDGSMHFYEIVQEDTYGLENIKSKGLQPKIVFDIGGHIGSFSFKVKQLWPDVKIIFVEPNKYTMILAKKNLERFDNIVFVDGGIWYKKNKPKFFLKNYWKSAGSCADGFWLEREFFGQNRFDTRYLEKDYDVKFFTIESLMKTYKIDYIDLLKLDCEGAEIDFFRRTILNSDDVNVIVGEWHRGHWTGDQTFPKYNTFKQHSQSSFQSSTGLGDEQIFLLSRK